MLPLRHFIAAPSWPLNSCTVSTKPDDHSAREPILPTPAPGLKKLAGPALLLLMVLAVFGGPLFSFAPQVVSLRSGDIFFTFLGWREWGFASWKSGHFPTWNPYAYSGTPFFANMQSALLYPPNLIYWLLPAWRAVNLEAALSIYLSGVFTYFWLRGREMSSKGATYGATLVMFGGAHFLHVGGGHLPNLDAMAWLPLLLYAADRTLEESGTPRMLALPTAAAGFAMILLAGHVQYFYYSAITFSFYLLVRAVGRVDLAIWPSTRRCLLALMSLPLGAGLASVQLWPAYLLSTQGLRQNGVSLLAAGTFSLPPCQLIGLLAPGFFGNDVRTLAGPGSVPYWGSWLDWEMGVFIGVPAALLICLGLAGGSRRLRVECVLLSTSFLLLALGCHTPMFEPMFRFFPGYSSFRGPAKWSYFALPILALLAAHGFDRWVVTPPDRRALRQLNLLALGVALGGIFGSLAILRGASAGIGGAWANFMRASAYTSVTSATGLASWYSSPPFVKAAASHASQELLSMSLIAGLAILCIASRNRWPRSAWALPALGTVQLLWLALNSLPTFAPDEVRRPQLRPLLAQQPPDVRYMQLYDLTGGSGGLTGLHDLQGDDPFVSRRYAQFLAASQGDSPEKAMQNIVWRQDSPLLQYLRCLGAVTSSQPGIYNITRLKRPPLPHVFLVSDWRVEAGQMATFSMLGDAGFKPRSSVILEKPPEPAFPSTTAPVDGEARVLESTDNTLTVAAHTQAPCLLVITDPLSEGWSAEPLTGSVQPHYALQYADGVVGAIALHPGEHRLKISYRPPGLGTGATLSAVSLLIWSLLLGCGLWRRTRGAAAIRITSAAPTASCQPSHRDARVLQPGRRRI